MFVDRLYSFFSATWWIPGFHANFSGEQKMDQLEHPGDQQHPGSNNNNLRTLRRHGNLWKANGQAVAKALQLALKENFCRSIPGN